MSATAAAAPFTQSGGTNTISNYLDLAAGTARGTYTQSGGLTTISNSLYLGCTSGANASYSLGGTGQLSAAGEYVGQVSGAPPRRSNRPAAQTRQVTSRSAAATSTF